MWSLGALSPHNFTRPTKISHPNPNICIPLICNPLSRLILFHQSLWILLLPPPPPPPPPPPHPSPSLLNSQIHLLNFRVLISQEFKKCLYLSPVFLFAFTIFSFYLCASSLFFLYLFIISSPGPLPRCL